MIDTVEDRNRSKVKRIDALEASYVVPELLGVAATLMVGVNATDRAEIVLGCHGIELIEAQLIAAAHDSKVGEWNRCHNGASATTDGAVTAPRIDYAVRQVKLQLDSAAVARRSVALKDLGATDDLNHLLLPGHRKRY